MIISVTIFWPFYFRFAKSLAASLRRFWWVQLSRFFGGTWAVSLLVKSWTSQSEPYSGLYSGFHSGLHSEAQSEPYSKPHFCGTIRIMRLIALARYLKRTENHFRCWRPIRLLVKFGENFQSFARQNVCVSDLGKVGVQSNTLRYLPWRFAYFSGAISVRVYLQFSHWNSLPSYPADTFHSY